MTEELRALASSVQRNCHISDAVYARDYTLCIYLLKMREYYRWEKGYGFGDRLPTKAFGAWLTEREGLWQTLEARDFDPLSIDGTAYDPFDAPAINDQLARRSLVYSGGFGAGGKPHFFLGKLEQRAEHEGRAIYIAGKEYARDITAPPAMTVGGTIFIRKESIRRMLWEKTEEWAWHKNESPMSRAMSHYGFEEDFAAALDAMTEAEAEAVLLHEVGELEVGQRLGEEWERLLLSLPRTRVEYTLRAVRDHLADCVSTLPTLLEREAVASLHFYFANLAGLRKHIFPLLPTAYAGWVTSNDLRPLREAVERGRHHWEAVVEELMALGTDGEERERQARLEERLEEIVL